MVNIASFGGRTQYTQPLDLTETKDQTLCFIKAILAKRFTSLIITDEEYYRDYVKNFVGPNKEFKINQLRQSKEILKNTYMGFVLRRFEPFEEDILRAIEAIMASGIPDLFSQKPSFADKLQDNPNSKSNYYY